MSTNEVPESERVIFHVDMDSFYASCELRDKPEFRNRPFIVGADPKNGRGRGVVISCNYAARKLGIHSALPISKAWELCPDAVYVRPNFRLYEEVSKRIMLILKKFTPKVEVVSIDEAYLDMTHSIRESASESTNETSFRIWNSEAIANRATRIKEEILISEKITCSIGVSNSKIVAKIATDTNKPDGLIIVMPEKVKDFLSPLQVGKIPGVGRVTQQILQTEFGITTIGDLSKSDTQKLLERFGRFAFWLKRVAEGRDDSQVEEGWQPRSISGETTFEEDESDFSKVVAAMRGVALDVYERLNEEGYEFSNIAVKIRFEGFETHSRQKALASPSRSLEILIKDSEKLLSEFKNSGKKVRLVGVRVSRLRKVSSEQASLLEWSGSL